MEKNKIIRVLVSILLIAAAVFFVGGFAKGDVKYFLKDRAAIGPLTNDDITYLDVEAPAATSKDGTVSAKDWAAVYPEISVTMGANSENSYVTSYLEEDPYLVNLYEGFGFAKDYGSARGHEYTLEDVAATERPHPMANCLTCKTPNFTKLVNDQGVGVYKMDFEEVYAQMEESVSCYNCHGNDPGKGGMNVVTHDYVHTALGENESTIDNKTLVCGQCHIEYYFTPDNKETMMPYHSIEEMTPEAILEYYDSFDFFDWEQESTGAKLLKAQHPEMETVLLGKHAGLLSCSDCHMPMVQDEDGKVYHSHTIVSPLEDEMLLSKCATCHEGVDMVEFVHRIQDRVTAREKEVGNKISEFKDELVKANAAGTMSEDELDAVRKLYREAQWFFDYCYVENAEGAHNEELAMRCLDTAEEKTKEGMALLGK